MTVRELITASLRKIGVTATGETPSSAEITDGLECLNTLLDSWSNENLLIPSKVKETFPFVASQSTYTMGSGGDFDTTNPMLIELALCQTEGDDSVETYVDIITKEEYAGITNKSTSSSIPFRVYPEYGGSLTTLIFYPVPTEANNVVLYSWKPLTTYSSLSTSLALRPGYERALIFNLSLEIAPEYGIEPSGLVMQSAMEAKENIKRMNTKEYFLTSDEAALRTYQGGFNYLTGEFK